MLCLPYGNKVCLEMKCGKKHASEVTRNPTYRPDVSRSFCVFVNTTLHSVTLVSVGHFRSIRAYMVPRRGNSGEVQRRGNNGERNLALPSSIVTWDTGRCGACAHLGRPRTGLVPRGWWPGGVTAVGTVSRVYLEWMRLRWTGEGGRGSRAAVNDGLGVGRLMSAWWGESR